MEKEESANENSNCTLNQEENPKNEEPFDFALLPADLQYEIVEKLDYKDFSVLDRSSRLGNAICWAKSYSIPCQIGAIFVNRRTTKCGLLDFHHRYVSWHVVSKPPVRIRTYHVIIQGGVTSGRMKTVSKLFEENGTTAETVELRSQPFAFKAADLNRLIQAVKPREFYSFSVHVPREFFEIEAIQNVEEINLRMECDITDDEFLALNCPLIKVKNESITAQGLNLFLKQWRRREREIEAICIVFDDSFGTRNFQDILDGLEANIIWTPEFHYESLVGKIKLEEFELFNTGDPENMYSIHRLNNIEEKMFVKMSNGRFEVFHSMDEETYLFGFLTQEQAESINRYGPKKGYH